MSISCYGHNGFFQNSGHHVTRHNELGDVVRGSADMGTIQVHIREAPSGLHANVRSGTPQGE